jgi:hypothetical protein
LPSASLMVCRLRSAPCRGRVKAADVVEEEAGAGGVGFDDEGLEFEGVEVLFDLLVAGFGFEFDGWDGAGHGDLCAFALLAGHEALDVFWVGGLDAVSGGGDEEDAGVAERDGPVAVVGDDEADGHDSVGDVVDAEEGHLVFGVVWLGGDGEFFVGVDFEGGEVGGWLDGGRGVVGGAARATAAGPVLRQQKQFGAVRPGFWSGDSSKKTVSGLGHGR